MDKLTGYCCQLKGNPHFFTGALGYTWKTKKKKTKKKTLMFVFIKRTKRRKLTVGDDSFSFFLCSLCNRLVFETQEFTTTRLCMTSSGVSSSAVSVSFCMADRIPNFPRDSRKRRYAGRWLNMTENLQNASSRGRKKKRLLTFSAPAISGVESQVVDTVFEACVRYVVLVFVQYRATAAINPLTLLKGAYFLYRKCYFKIYVYFFYTFIQCLRCS